MTDRPFLVRVEVFFGARLYYQTVYLIPPIRHKDLPRVLSKERLLDDIGSETQLHKWARDIVLALPQSKWDRGLRSLHTGVVKVDRYYPHADHGLITEAAHFTLIDYIQVTL